MKLVILDRDGVINHDSPNYIKTPNEWQAIDGSLQAIAKLTNAGYKIAIATNQSGIAKKLYSEKTLNDIHSKMQKILTTLGSHIDLIKYCPHNEENNCSCRKPKPGMIKDILQHYHINTTKNNIWMIGDAIRDLQAGASAGCQPVLVLTGKGEKSLQTNNPLIAPEYTFANLATAVESLIINKQSEYYSHNVKNYY